MRTVLVCDADIETRQSIERLIESQPILSVTATTGNTDALDCIRSVQPKLIWLDLGPVPEQALSVLKELKEHFPMTAIIVSGTKPDEALIRASFRLGASDYLCPPDWERDTPPAIQSLRLHGERTIRPDLLTHPPFWFNHLQGELDINLRGANDHILNLALTGKSDNDAVGDQRIVLPGGYSIEIEYHHACEGYWNIICQACHPDWIEPILLSASQWRGPAFRWLEVMEISRKGRVALAEGQHAGAALLLLLPWVWLTNSDDRLECQFEVGQALDSLDVCKPGLSLSLAENLTAPMQCPVSVRSYQCGRDIRSDESISWQQDPLLGWINNSTVSWRNPTCEGPRLSADQFKRIKEFFTTIHVS